MVAYKLLGFIGDLFHKCLVPYLRGVCHPFLKSIHNELVALIKHALFLSLPLEDVQELSISVLQWQAAIVCDLYWSHVVCGKQY